MPNNFKISGDYYVSKFGNDSWDGLTPDTPKRTVQAGLNLITAAGKTLIIGSGYYNETISRSVVGFNPLTIRGDGIVVLTGNSFAISNQQANIVISNVIFTGYTSVILGSAAAGADQFLTISNCTFLCPLDFYSNLTGNSGMSFTSCVFINQTLTTNRRGSGGSITYTLCVFINSKITSIWPVSTFINNYSDASSIVVMNSSATAANFNYNNIQGPILMNIASTVTTGTYQDVYGRYYNLSIATSTGDGTIGNPYGRPYTLGTAFSYSTHKILYPTYNVNSISQDPLFNDILSQDFTLQSGSPHIGRASDGINNIGGTKYAIRRSANSSSFSGSSATVDGGLILSYDNYVISGSAVTGSVTSAPIFISSSAKVIQEIDYNGLLAFNKDTGSLSGSNVNVPDFDTYTSASGNPGANPDRLVYYMRLTTGSTQPAVDADWDNGNLWTRGDYNVFEWNSKPSIDIYGRGNGDPNFVVANSSYLKATYVQMKVKLRNNYLL